MVKVYIVTSGEYSDYSIEAVFSQKADAEAFLYWHGRLHILVELVEEGDDGN